MRAPAIVVLVLSAIAATPRSARACQCSGPMPPAKEAFRSAALVVEARVLSHQFVTYEGFHTRLAITKTHKGPQRDEVVIVAAKTCAYGFAKGERYLVYAHADGNDGFSTTYCERNAPLAEAKGDIASFGGTPASAAAQPIVVLTPRLLEWTSSPTTQWLRVVALLLASM